MTKEPRKAYMARYHKEHKESIRLRQATYRQEHLDKVRTQETLFRETHRDILRERTRKKRHARTELEKAIDRVKDRANKAAKYDRDPTLKSFYSHARKGGIKLRLLDAETYRAFRASHHRKYSAKNALSQIKTLQQNKENNR